MNTTVIFFVIIPLLAFILLFVNLIFAPHNPYQEKNSAFECGFHSFLGQNRTQFSISFFIFALLFLLFDLEILLIYPYIVSSYINESYGLIIMLIFFLILTLGFAFELGKNALKIYSRQTTPIYYKSNIVLTLRKKAIDFISLVLNLIIINRGFVGNVINFCIFQLIGFIGIDNYIVQILTYMFIEIFNSMIYTKAFQEYIRNKLLESLIFLFLKIQYIKSLSYKNIIIIIFIYLVLFIGFIAIILYIWNSTNIFFFFITYILGDDKKSSSGSNNNKQDPSKENSSEGDPSEGDPNGGDPNKGDNFTGEYSSKKRNRDDDSDSNPRKKPKEKEEDELQDENIVESIEPIIPVIQKSANTTDSSESSSEDSGVENYNINELQIKKNKAVRLMRELNTTMEDMLTKKGDPEDHFNSIDSICNEMGYNKEESEERTFDNYKSIGENLQEKLENLEDWAQYCIDKRSTNVLEDDGGDSDID